MTSLKPIVVQDLSISYPSNPVLTGINLTASPGCRVALIGENGAGKSTLLRSIAGVLSETAQLTGRLERPDDLIWLPQEPPFRDTDSVSDALDRALAPLRKAVAAVQELADRLDEPQAAQRYAAALEFAEMHDAWDAERRAVLVAHRLGLGDLAPDRLLATLSGGQRTRLALATAIARRPDALLLDEPTNHLDDAATDALAEFLCDFPGAVLFASHDRVFLDQIATDLIDVDPSAFGTDGKGGRRFGGGWSEYERARHAARERWEQTYAEQQRQIRTLRAATRVGADVLAHNRGPTDNDKFIHKFKGQNVDRSLARRKRDARRRLAEAEETQVRKPRPQLRFDADLAAPGTAERMVLIRDLVVTGRLSLSRLDMRSGEHLLVTGANGAGKSTLLGVLSGRLRPDAGTVHTSARRVAELQQDPSFLDASRPARAVYSECVGAALAEQRPLRELGLLAPREIERPVDMLSVGQRRRLALAIAIATRPGLLLLDEPTNHLSLALVGELEDAFTTTPGTLVVASHDRWLRRRWTGRHLELRARTEDGHGEI